MPDPAPTPNPAAGPATRKPASRARRWIGHVIIAAIWCALLSLLAFFGLGYAIFRDLEAPEQSRLVAGTRFKALAERVFDGAFCPLWQEDPACAQFDPALVYVPKPGVARFRGIEFDTPITTTPEGLRRQPGLGEGSKAAPVVITGDSYAMGWGVNDNETYSAILEQRFRNPTVNASVSSYGTARELTRLQRLGLLARAEILVIQYCPNDADENRAFLRPHDRRAGRPDPAEAWAMIQARPTDATADVAYGRVLAALTHVLKNSFEQRSFWRRGAEFVRGNVSPPASDAIRRPGLADDFLAVLDRFPELAAKPIIVIELKPFHEASNFLSNLARRVGARRNIRVLPLALERDDFYRFDAHLRARGHEKVAAQIDDAIRALGLRSTRATYFLDR